MRPMRLLMAILLALLAPGAAQAAWHEASTPHFLIYSDDDPATLRAFAEKLERFDAAMRVMHRVPDVPLGPANRLTIYVVPDLGAVQRLFGRGSSVAGFYISRAEGPIAVTPRSTGEGGRTSLDAQTVLFHEYAHHFMFQNFAEAFPAWLSEGFAEFNATVRFEKDGAVGFGAPPLYRAENMLTWDALHVEELLSRGTGQLRGAELDSLYGRGWLLTHFLKMQPNRAGQLGAYVAALNGGKTSIAAAQASFGDLKQLNRELNAYVRQRRLPYVRVEPVAIRIGTITVRPLRAGEAAIMNVLMVSKVGVTPARAKTLVVDARRAAQPYPADPAVQAALAEAEYDARHLDQAEAAADRALAADPSHVDALIYKGRVRMAKAQAAKATDAATWTEVRRWLLAANRASPDDPEPLILFYRSFAEQGARPSKSAVAGLLRAFDLAPQDDGVRLAVARQQLSDGKAAEARAALAPIAFAPHGGRLSQLASSVIGKIDADGAAQALAEWERLAKQAEPENGA
jgi:tetratricopeptide (TPR) repeat protein